MIPTSGKMLLVQLLTIATRVGRMQGWVIDRSPTELFLWRCRYSVISRSCPSFMNRSNRLVGTAPVLPTSRNWSDSPMVLSAIPKDPEDQQKHNNKYRYQVTTTLLKGLWKGITMPFPLLRRIIILTHPKQKGNHQISIGVSIRDVYGALFLYLITGVVAYTRLVEHWPVVDALYFSCVCFTTVGYGDLSPTTSLSKIFTCGYGLTGIACLGAAVATIGGQLLQVEMKTIQQSRQVRHARIVQLFEHMPQVLKHHRGKTREQQLAALREAQQRVQEQLNQPIPWWITLQTVLLRVLPAIWVIVSGSLLLQRLDGRNGLQNPVDTIYFGIITASTIGLGDVAPTSPAARMFAILYIPLAVAAAGEVLSSVAVALVHRRQREIYNRQLQNDLTIEYLRQMDLDGDGKISREEYVQFMLVEMGRVSAEELNELYAQFERLDVTRSGYLDKEDLELMAELRGATVKQATRSKD